jgi:glycerol-3-phosphate acyltransferase PlsY
VVGKVFYKKDVRKEGSGNAGATNTFRVLGAAAGMIVLVLDIAKGIAAPLLAHVIHPEYISSIQFVYLQMIFGLAAALGHIFPVYLGFKGGKGVATFFGVVLYLFPIAAIICMITFFIIFLITHYVSLGSLIASVTFAFSVLTWYADTDKWPILIFGLAIPVIIMITHKKNIQRLIKGTESKLYFTKKSTQS